MTERVIGRDMTTGMTSSNNPNELPPEKQISVIVGVGPHRFAILRKEHSDRIHALDGTRFDQLNPGDKVIFDGKPVTIRAIETY